MLLSVANHADMNDPNAFVFYRYHPSLVGAVVFVILFSTTTGLHAFQAAKHRSGFFIPFIVGGFFECVGYVGRALAHSHQYTLSIYIMQTLLLLVAPALFAASIYMTLGRLIHLTDGEAFAPIQARWLTKIFVCGDIVSFFVQAGGGGLMANVKTMTFGKHLIIIGLLLQIIFFGIFIITSGIFHFRIVRSPTPASTYNNWKPYMYTLYSASILILIRSVFRVIEFSGGNDGVLLRNEVFLYIFDALLMTGVMVSLNAVHPGMLIGRKAHGGAIRMTERRIPSSEEGVEQKTGAFNSPGGTV